MFYIGDLHGDHTAYNKIMKIVNGNDAIQVGDFGIGFPQHQDFPIVSNLKFIRGNHDNPNSCKLRSDFIPDGTIIDDTLFMGGAMSIDKNQRIVGVDYWDDEEISKSQFDKIIFETDFSIIRNIVSHDAPYSVIKKLFGHTSKNTTKESLEYIFKNQKIKRWIYGHYHVNTEIVMNETQFIGIAHNDFIEI